MVALGENPAQMTLPLAGVAVFKAGITVGAETGHVTKVVGPVAEHPLLPAERLARISTLVVAPVVEMAVPEV
jgi:hypothetical protein